jgi:hypothetical protein
VWALPFLTVLAPSERYYENSVRAAKTLTDWVWQAVLQVRREKKFHEFSQQEILVILQTTSGSACPGPGLCVYRFRNHTGPPLMCGLHH